MDSWGEEEVREPGEAGALGGVRMKCGVKDEARAMKEKDG